MDKGEKKVFSLIVSTIIIFILIISVSSYIGRIENQVKNNAQITIGEARHIALNDAKTDETEVVFTKQNREIEQGLYAYEIEFNDGLTKYEYEIDAQTGEIISRFSIIIR